MNAFQELDVHNMTKVQAVTAIDAMLRRADAGVYRIRVIHGYHGGTVLRDAGCIFNACRSDGLVSILSILSGLCLVISGIFLAIVFNDVAISLSQEYVTHSDAVSTHVGDQTGKSG